MVNHNPSPKSETIYKQTHFPIQSHFLGWDSDYLIWIITFDYPKQTHFPIQSHFSGWDSDYPKWIISFDYPKWLISFDYPKWLITFDYPKLSRGILGGQVES